MVERDELFVLLNEYKVLGKNLERNVSDRNVTVKAMTESVNHLKINVSLLPEATNLFRRLMKK